MTMRPNHHQALISQNETLPSEPEWVLMQRMASAFCQSGLYKNVANVAQAIAIVQTGRELGIGPSTALREMYILPGQGRPSASAALLSALAQRDHGDDAIRVTTTTNTECTVLFKRRSWSTPGKLTFTIEDAKRAGLVKSSGNWEKYPRAMLRSRAVAEACRTAFQDSILGLYSVEEMAPDGLRVTPEGEVILDDAETVGPDREAERAIDTHIGEILAPASARSSPDQVALDTRVPDAHNGDGAAGAQSASAPHPQDAQTPVAALGEIKQLIAELRSLATIRTVPANRLADINGLARAVGLQQHQTFNTVTPGFLRTLIDALRRRQTDTRVGNHPPPTALVPATSSDDEQAVRTGPDDDKPVQAAVNSPAYAGLLTRLDRMAEENPHGDSAEAIRIDAADAHEVGAISSDEYDALLGIVPDDALPALPF